ncbi:multidrug ABC transporter permease [Paracoccus suum]|uniref:Transport permease protein n=1 Tax=Paracoccus suum TaxID=2259340 RepID=A0A344PLQ7_9RHOB|nr:ABC transporter permease [Paracoccus suum]AXC50312.1 multidrug ABC transporter permease [Paracoccus suum]
MNAISNAEAQSVPAPADAAVGPGNASAPPRLPPRAYAIAFAGIARREALRFVNQRGRFLAALVRPLVWLFIFAAGFRAVLGLSITPPYNTYVLYEVYVTPGLVAMIQLFNGMQSSLSMVYDRETGAMRTLLVSPLPRWFLLLSKLVAGVFVSIIQAAVFLAIAWLWDIRPPLLGYLAVVPALVLSGLMLGALGLLLSSAIRQLENFAGVMNFVIFPMFFASSALYPLWRMNEGSPLLRDICALNPFTYAVELIRFALYLQVDWLSLGVVMGCLVLFFGLAVRLYDPARGGPRRKEG